MFPVCPFSSDAPERSGYKHNHTCNPNRNYRRRKRKRQIIWFNPPYNANLETNIRKFFLKLFKKHLKRGSKFNKVFNKNTLKISYSCMPNVKSLRSARNKKILMPTVEENPLQLHQERQIVIVSNLV